MIKVAIANQKGGVGKTSVCTQLGAELKKRGYTVRIYDNDPQMSAADHAKHTPADQRVSTFSVPYAITNEDFDGLDGLDFALIDGRGNAENDPRLEQAGYAS